MFTPSIVKLPDSKEAVMLVPDTSNKQMLCIIPRPVLEHLTVLLPKSSIEEIIVNFSERAGEVHDVKTWLELLQEELDFHSSINLLKEYFLSEAKEEKLDVEARTV